MLFRSVTVNLSGGGSIVIASGSTSGTYVAAAQGEDPYVDTTSVAKGIASVDGGTIFESLAFSTAAISTSITDTTQTTSLSLAAATSVDETTAITYTATLTNSATAPVTVNLSGGGSIVIASGGTSGTYVEIGRAHV